MPAFRSVTRIQDEDDFAGPLTDGYVLEYNASAGKFQLANLTPMLPPNLAFKDQANAWTQSKAQALQLQDYGGQVFNVKSYGATGTGTTDDTTAIFTNTVNAAMASLPAST